MNTALNRNQFVQSVAPVLRQLLSGFALVAAVRENLYAATSDEAKGSRRASLGRRAAAKRPHNPGHPERVPQQPEARKSTCVRRPRNERFGAKMEVCIIRTARVS